MIKVYEAHWNSKEKNCESCGKYLGSENLSIFHDHLLPKRTYPQFRYVLENLFLCCFVCHCKREGGFPTDIHSQAIENAKKRFL